MKTNLNENIYYKFFKNSPDGMILACVKTKKILTVNNAICKMLGYSERELVNMKITDIHPKKDLPWILKKFEEQVKKKVIEVYNIPVQKKDGSIFYTNINSLSTKIGETHCLLGIFKDVTETKKLQEKLQENETKFYEIFNKSPYSICIQDKTTKKIIDANSSFQELIGYRKEELVSNQVNDKKIWVDIKDYKKVMLALKNKQKVIKSEYQFRKKSGEIIIGLYSADTIILDSKEYVISRILDITETKKIENQLSTLIMRMPIGCIIWDKDFKATSWNPSAEKIFGFKQKEVIGKYPYETIVPAKNIKIVREIYANIMKGNHDEEHVSPNITKKNHNIFCSWQNTPIVEIDGTVVGILSMVRDVTKDFQTKKQIFDLKAIDEAILNSIGDGVFACDTKGNIILFNNMAVKMTGFSKKEAIGSHYNKIINFINEFDSKSNNKFIEKAIQEEQVTKMANHTMLIRKDGTKISVANSAAPIKDLYEKIFGSVVIFKDMSKEYAIEKTKTEFISIASHQLKTPITGIKWFTEILLKSTKDKKEYEYAKQIAISNERMIFLVDNLLNISRITMSNKYTINVQDYNIMTIIKDVIAELSPIAESKSIILLCSGKHPKNIRINIDTLKMHQVFQNVISNAIKYSKEKTKILISCSQGKDDIVFAIKDNGIGIPKNQQNQVFSKFFRANNASVMYTDGIGLGLYISKIIIEAHKGKIWFRSIKSKGSTFYISIPTNTAK